MAKVTKLKLRLHSKELSKSYPRIERGNATLSPDYLTEDMSPFVPPKEGDLVYAVVKEEPFQDYELASEIDLQEGVPLFNSILIYRVLKLQYGQPDILGGLVNIDPANRKFHIGAGIEWGYVLKLADNLFAEIRSVQTNTRFKLRFWIQSIPEELEEREEYGQLMAQFLEAFVDGIEKNAHLFNEEQEISEEAREKSAISNIFSERYKSAIEIFDFAKESETLPDRQDLTFDQSARVNTGGSIYMSAAILFVISLESLLNTIYHLLLRPEFQAEPYERITIRGDLDLRLISAHLFCSGFTKQILVPHTELWGKLLKLRRFRNDIIHGNITPHHYAYALQEDINTFFYCGVTDYRGRKAEEKASRNYPTTMAQINESVVSEIKETVDQIVQAIIAAADEKHKKWLDSWLFEAIIPRFELKKEGYQTHPLGPKKEPLVPRSAFLGQ